jgi:hypothetical protein
LPGLTESEQLIPDQDFLVGMKFTVNDGTAKSMRCYIIAFDLPGAASKEQSASAAAKLRRGIADDGLGHGFDNSVGEGCYRGIPLKFTSDQIAELISRPGVPARRISYLMGHAEWKNDAGADFHTDACMWMESPKTNIVAHPGWHDCAF